MHDIRKRNFMCYHFSDINHSSVNQLYCLTNITPDKTQVSMPMGRASEVMKDVISGRVCDPRNLVLSPYEYVWLSEREI